MLTSMSAGAYLFLLIVLTRFMTIKSAFRIIILIVSIFIIVNLFLEPIALKRFMKFGSAISTFDIHKIYSADQSAALRVIPSFICLQKIDLFTVDGWFGYGIDYVSDFMSNYLAGVPKGYTGGGLLLYAVEYGFCHSSSLQSSHSIYAMTKGTRYQQYFLDILHTIYWRKFSTCMVYNNITLYSEDITTNKN